MSPYLAAALSLKQFTGDLVLLTSFTSNHPSDFFSIPLKLTDQRVLNLKHSGKGKVNFIISSIQKRHYDNFNHLLSR